MAHDKSKQLNLRADDGPAEDPDRWTWLTQTAFILSLATILARATVLEIIRNPLDVFPGGGPQPRGAGPTTILVLNLLLLLPALLVLLRRFLDARYALRWSWGHALLAALGAWAMLSTFWSADRFSAAINSFTFFCGVVVFWTMTQLVRSFHRLRIVAAACFGLLLLLIAQGLIHQFDEVPNMRDYWEKNGREVLRQQGIEQGTFAARQFEQRVVAGEMFGFNTSPNTFAALLVMLMIVSAAIAIQRITDARENPVPTSQTWALLPLLAIPAALWIIYYTNSRTAFITPLLAGALLLLIWKTRVWIAAHHRAVFIAIVVAFILGAAALVAHGIYHGSLPHVSLTFRWRYWVGAFRALQGDLHWLVGVGWNQFGAHYMIHRLPEAAEEVKDPHNFIVKFFVELGIIGGALAVGWMLKLWWELTRSITPTTLAKAQSPRQFLPLAMIALGAIALNVLATIDFSQDPWYALYEVLKRVLFGGLLLLGLAVAMLRRIDPAEFENPSRAAPWIRTGILVALAIFLIHNLIDFSLFETGPMMLFMMLAGGAVGIALPNQPTRRSKPAIAGAGFGVAAIIWVAVGIFFVWPVADAEELAYQADLRIQSSRPAAAAALFQQAFERVPINADYAFRAARARMMTAGAAAEKINPLLSAAINADPLNGKYYLSRARYELSRTSPDRQRVIEDFAQALRLNPQDVSTRIEFADLLHVWGMLDDARRQYRIALEANERLPADEGERLPRREIERIETWLSS